MRTFKITKTNGRTKTVKSDSYTWFETIIVFKINESRFKKRENKWFFSTSYEKENTQRIVFWISRNVVESIEEINP